MHHKEDKVFVIHVSEISHPGAIGMLNPNRTLIYVKRFWILFIVLALYKFLIIILLLLITFLLYH